MPLEAVTTTIRSSGMTRMAEIKVQIDGRTGTISADSEQELQAKLARAREKYPELEVLEQPDPVQMDTTLGEDILDTARGLGQGVTFNFGDELGGAVSAGVNALLLSDEEKALLAREGIDIGYQGSRDRERARLAESQERNPYLYGGGELGGGVAVPGLGAFKGAQRLNQAIQGMRPAGALAVTGGAASGAAALGASEADNPLDLAIDTGIGAGIGAAAAPVLSGALSKGAEYLGGLGMGLIRRFAADPETAANMRVRQALEADNINTPEEARALLDEYPEGSLADIGPNLREEGVLAAKQPGEGRTIAEDFVQARQMTQQDRLNQVVRDELGARQYGVWGDDYYKFMDDLTKGRKEQARPLYEEAYLQDIVPTEEMVRISKTKAFEDAARRAMANMRNKLDTFGPPRPPQTDGRVSTQFMDQILRELRDESNRLFRAGSNEAGSDVSNIYKALRTEVLEQNTKLREARGVFAGAKQLEEAADAGRGLLGGRKQYAEDVERLLSDMTDGEKDAFSIGLIRGIMDRLADAAETSDAGRRLFNSTRVVNLLRTAFRDEDAFQNFYDAVRRESRYQETRNRVTGGSPTAQLIFGDAQGRPADDMAATGTGFVVNMLRRMLNETIDDPSQLGPDDYTKMSELLFGEIDDGTITRIFNTAFSNRMGPPSTSLVPSSFGTGGALEITDEVQDLREDMR